MNMREIIPVLAVVWMLQPSFTQAGENSAGPVEVITGTWGGAEDQFGFRDRYNKLTFPTVIIADEEKNLVVADPVNKRVKVYDAKGTLQAIIKPTDEYRDAEAWPPQNIATAGDRIIVNDETRYQVFDYKGRLKKDFTVPDSRFEAFTADGQVILHQLEKNRYGSYEDRGYRRYSPEGMVIASYAAMPLLSGSVKQEQEHKSNITEEWWTITYDDKVFTIVEGGQHKYARDQRGNVYGIGSPPFERYDECGIRTGTLDWPKSEYVVIRPATAGSGELREAIVEYGDPVIAPSGDIYTWKRTPTSYSILKWTWQDKKNVNVAWQTQPRNVAATAAADGILVSWDISLQDPACITGYQIGRSKVPGGPYEKIGTVGKGVLRHLDTAAAKGTPYFYAVRSIIKKEYSGYANEAEASR
jgi:hypothetical protein